LSSPVAYRSTVDALSPLNRERVRTASITSVLDDNPFLLVRVNHRRSATSGHSADSYRCRIRYSATISVILMSSGSSARSASARSSWANTVRRYIVAQKQSRLAVDCNPAASLRLQRALKDSPMYILRA
jgi:hypothetical protein